MVRFVLDDDKVYKVVAESEDAIWVVDYDNPCAPKIVKQDGMKNLKEIPVPDDYIQESVVSRAIYDTARKRLGILSAILSDNAYITNAALRQRALAKIAQDARVSQKTLKRWYYSYLAYGERGLYPVSKIKKSKTLPQEHEKKIASALSKYYYSPKKRSLKTTYEMMLLKYYRNEQRMIVPDHPTYGQFLYYYRKNRDVVRKLISREGIGEYQKNARPLLGKGDAGITTIGYFEIDATVADIYVVSRFDRKPIGRPVLYVAIDIASRMIAGIYVGFEESAEAVLACLANAACDKVDFCKEHGISITADMWPSKGLPGTIYTDRGSDFASFRVKELCSTFNMEITTLPPYRPDLKGYVERAIGCIQERYKPLLRGKGVVDKTSLERNQPDYAQQAILDIEEYTKVVIECVLYYNDSHVQKKYERSQAMIEQGVPPIASELWKFYDAQTKANIIYADDELLQMLFLPRKKARITRYGVENDGIYYYSDELKTEFVCTGINGSKQVDIAFMPNNNSFIYLVDNGIYHKYGLPGDEVKASEPENEPSQREPAKPQDAVPKELPVQHEQCESVSNSEKNAILEIKAIQADREDSLLDVSIDDIEPEPEMATVSIKPILDVQEDALEVDLADESNTEISLDLSSDSDGSANFQDAMSLEDELAAMEATLSASHDDGVFNPTDDELGEDEDDSLDLDSMLDVPGSPVDEAPDEPDVTEATKATTPVATEPPADTALPEQKDDSEQLPTKGKRSSRKKQKKDDDTPVTRTNAFQPNAKTQADEEDSSLVEKCIPFQTEAETRKERPKPTRTEHKKSSKTDAQTESLFGRDFQNRTKSGSGGSKKRSSSKKAQTIQSDGEQMRFDESNTDVIKCKV